jgi:hypothetical protein
MPVAALAVRPVDGVGAGAVGAAVVGVVAGPDGFAAVVGGVGVGVDPVGGAAVVVVVVGAGAGVVGAGDDVIGGAVGLGAVCDGEVVGCAALGAVVQPIISKLSSSLRMGVLYRDEGKRASVCSLALAD